MSAVRRDVRDSFSRAAERYDRHAGFQRTTALTLWSGVAPDAAPGQVVDVGCGTGHGTRLMRSRWPSARFVAVDFAQSMLAACGTGNRLCADAEALPLAGASVDFFWSSLTLQWCDVSRFAREAARVLRPGGRLAVSTLGPATFDELRCAFAAVDRRRHTIDFHDRATVAEAFAEAGLEIVAVRGDEVTCDYPALVDLLASVRGLGANRVRGDNRRTGLMGKEAWRRFADAYETLRTPRGLPLTYETIFLHAEK